MLEKLDRINPKMSPNKNRKAYFHEHLTEGYGIEKLKRQLQEVQTLMAVSDTVSGFKKLFMKRFPKTSDEGELLADENVMGRPHI